MLSTHDSNRLGFALPAQRKLLPFRMSSDNFVDNPTAERSTSEFLMQRKPPRAPATLGDPGLTSILKLIQSERNLQVFLCGETKGNQSHSFKRLCQILWMDKMLATFPTDLFLTHAYTCAGELLLNITLVLLLLPLSKKIYSLLKCCRPSIGRLNSTYYPGRYRLHSRFLFSKRVFRR